MNKALLTPEQKVQFEREGFLVIKNFYDIESQILPIQKSIFNIIALVAKENKINLPIKDFSSKQFDNGFQYLIQHDRKLGSIVYDAIKQIPAFVRLLSSAEHEQIMKDIRGTDAAAVEAGGYGIRIDIPFEDDYRTPWHQDFSSHFRSKDGLTFWATLTELTLEMGPMEICQSSHREGPFPLTAIDPNHPDARGGVGYHIDKESEIISHFEKTSPLTAPGDLIVLDWMTLHQSGKNTSHRSRWSMQMRYFNFSEAWGLCHKWPGAFAAGNSPMDVIPELIVNKKKDMGDL